MKRLLIACLVLAVGSAFVIGVSSCGGGGGGGGNGDSGALWDTATWDRDTWE